MSEVVGNLAQDLLWRPARMVQTIMIRDPKVKSAIVQAWEGVRKLEGKFANTTWQVPGGAAITESHPDESYNIPFLLAYAVLDEVLTQLQNEGVFKCKNRRMLGAKMDASRNRLPWQEYDKVYSGKEERNDLAHHAKLVAKADCLAYINAIEVELKAWGEI